MLMLLVGKVDLLKNILLECVLVVMFLQIDKKFYQQINHIENVILIL